MKPLNEELIDRVLARIERDPATWHQGDFFAFRSGVDFCGTTACFAGHALLESGWTMDVKESEMFSYGHSVVVRDPSGKINVNYDDEAAELLGFTEDEAERVFYETQRVSLAELREVIAGIRANRVEASE